ncbi:acylphosphatase [Halalkalibacter okhensis]|uniref:acylphosphatase n=1 Tax=Halalkalibacter okhensis TaxID=333138 RepID=A0A0B0IF61_9BACI|nr:acylphosphatase [Halalkalibacter okhensis]KHF39915.1 acylphosphatase [Halalkalibacter okhensis]
MLVRYKAIVLGKVQGVGFRYFTQHEALKHHINGTVRNLDDGSVEIDAEGEREDIARFIQAVKKGPMFSKVQEIKINKQEDTKHYTSFTIAY